MKNKVRFYLGLSCLVLSWILPLFGFWVAQLDLSLAARATIIGLLTVGGPELFAILAVVCLGKENLVYIKDKILGYVKLIKPLGSVGRRRYRVGLVMFILPVVPAYIMAYAPQWLPDQAPLRLYVNLAADFMFLSSLFVLGGDFWDKLRALFVYDARAQFAGPQPGKK